MDKVYDDFSAQDAKDYSQKMWKSSSSFDEILSYLKDSGFSQGISVFILQRATNVSHSEAKDAVINSKAWLENKEANISLQNAIDDFLNEEEE